MNLDFLTYFQWIFLVILGLAILMGFLRGMKKTLFTLITMAIFYVIFFVTVIPVSKLLWTMDMPWLGGLLGNIDASLADFTSFEASIIDIMQFALGDSIDLSNPSAELMDLVVGIGQFALKIIYTVLYFTIILLVYKLICWILGMIILGKSEKGESKNRGFGALIGVGNGVMAIFVTLIMLGGIMSVSESMLSLLPQTEDDSTTLSFDGRGSVFEASNPIIALEEVSPFEDPEMAATIEDLRAMVDAYNNNFVVKLADSIQTA